MGTVFCQLSGLWELHCEPSNLILNFLFYQSQFHGFHYLHGLLFSQHFNHNVCLLVKLDVTGQSQEKGWADPTRCVPAGTSPGWTGAGLGSSDIPDRKAQTQPRYNKGSWSFWSNIYQKWCFFTILHYPPGIIFCSLCLNSFTLCLEFLWDLFPTLFSFYSAVLLRGIVLLSLRSLHF